MRRGIRARLRDTYPCRPRFGGCGSAAGQECRTTGGSPTQPHTDRWDQDTDARYRRYTSGLPGHLRPPAPVADPAGAGNLGLL